MKIALFGKGKMGQLVEKLALAKGNLITPLAEADVAIDFSHASAVIHHLELSLKAKVPLIIGTTGWESELPIAEERVMQEKGSCLYSPNFSLGILLFEKILKETAHLMNAFPDYDVAGIELHHNQKVDKPSGTAKLLARTLTKAMPRLIDCSFSSLRCGSIPGTHTIIFDSDVDTISLTHEARSRDGFAKGALIAADWLIGKQGFFTFSDLLGPR